MFFSNLVSSLTCVYGFQILHAGNPNKNAWKALIAAEYCGVKVELVKDFQMGVSNKTPEFLEMNPMGKVGVIRALFFLVNKWSVTDF